MKAQGVVGRFLYGAFFAAGVPLGLAWWARRLDASLGLPDLPPALDPILGAAVSGLGLILMLAAMRDLWVRGHGLPMNAYPPPEFVREGVYGWLRNPIYVGFGAIVAGASIAGGSPSGLYIVTPVTCLAMAALVAGYERVDLGRRFGDAALMTARIALPDDSDAPPALRHRSSTMWLVFGPWLALFYVLQSLGRPPDALSTQLALERDWPVWGSTEWLYASAYIVTPLAVFMAPTRKDLRRFALSGLWATLIIGLLWCTIPVVATNRPVTGTDPGAALLRWEQGHSAGVAAFPAFHVTWALLCALPFADCGRRTGRRSVTILGWALGIGIALSTITTGMHTLIEAGAGLLVFLLVRDPAAAWSAIRGATERLANSWHEWRVGPVRVISHGAFAAAGAFAGTVVAAAASSPSPPEAAVFVAVCIFVGALIWAQWLEGSPQLLRPFGWYGGLLGGLLGVIGAWLSGLPMAPLAAGFVTAAPFIQSLGRLRCLVQGCCHGGVAPSWLGIRYVHKRSRVTRIARLAGEPLHPTPLYSIAGNIAMALVLVRLRNLGAPDTFVIGIYFVMAGLARFVEESFRDEPQTMRPMGLPVYQWLALLSIAAGVLVSALPATPRAAGFSTPDLSLFASASAVALLAGFGLGVDFPGSNARFSRLAETD